jgi:hypothetical protein
VAGKPDQVSHIRQGGCRGALIVGDGGHPLPGSTVGQIPGFGLAHEPADTAGLSFEWLAGWPRGRHSPVGRETLAGSAGTRSGVSESTLPASACHPYLSFPRFSGHLVCGA